MLFYSIVGSRFFTTMDHCTSRRCLTSCSRLVMSWTLINKSQSFFYYLYEDIIELFVNYIQADWKPESPSKFGDIAELIKSIDSVKLEDKKPSGSYTYPNISSSDELCLFCALFFGFLSVCLQPNTAEQDIHDSISLKLYYYLHQFVVLSRYYKILFFNQTYNMYICHFELIELLCSVGSVYGRTLSHISVEFDNVSYLMLFVFN